MQAQALQRIVEAAREHPFYRETLPDVREFGDCPVLEKPALYDRIQEAMRIPSFRQGTYFSPTGGTTMGRPFFFPVDIGENKRQRELFARRLGSSGVIGADSIVLNLFPGGQLIRSMEIFNDYCDFCGATVLPVGAHSTDEFIWSTARQFGATILAGIPSRLVAFAGWVEAREQTVTLESVLFAGEFLQERKRAMLAKSLGVRRFDGVYGSAEMGLVAYQTDVVDPPIYRYPRDLIHIEVIDPNADGYGRLIATNLIRMRHPLLRYDTGDIGRLVGGDENEAWIELRGREADSFTIGGDYFQLDTFAPILSRFVQSQIVIDFDLGSARDRIRFHLVADGPVPEEQRREVKAALQGLLEADDRDHLLPEVEFTTPQSLIRRPGTMKVPFIVDLR